MVISNRLNLVEGRYCDSWTRVIGGKLILFCHNHTLTAGGNTRAYMRTHSVAVYEIEWDDFSKLEQRASFTHRQNPEWSTRRHFFKRDA